jgi:hypothetical protein
MHDGYRRLEQPVTHRRSVVSWKRSGVVFVRDVAEGAGEHALKLYWHVGPGFRLEEPAGEPLRFRGRSGEALTMVGVAGSGWTASVTEGEWSQAYGACEPAPVLTYAARLALPAEFAVLILPTAFAGSLDRMPEEGSGVAVYQCADQEDSHLLWFHDTGGAWQWREWESDAVSGCLSTDRETGATQLSLVGANYLRRDGQRLFP